MSVMFWLPSSLVGICQFGLRSGDSVGTYSGSLRLISHHWTADFSPGRSWLDSNKTQFVVGWLWRRNLGYHALILVIWIISSSVGKLTEWFSIFVILIVTAALPPSVGPDGVALSSPETDDPGWLDMLKCEVGKRAWGLLGVIAGDMSGLYHTTVNWSRQCQACQHWDLNIIIIRPPVSDQITPLDKHLFSTQNVIYFQGGGDTN